MIINYNSMAANSLRQLNINSANQAKSMAKLSSGLRINSAADDAAGLTISESMKGQIRGLNQASRNAQDGISMTQTAEGALNETTSILQRMRELAVQGSSDTNTSTDRQNIQQEMDQLTSQINGIGNTTEFNSQKLLNGEKNSAAGTDATVTTNIGNSTYKIDVAATGTGANAVTINFKTSGTTGTSFDSGSNTLTVALDSAKNNLSGGNVQTLIRAAVTPATIDLSAATVTSVGATSGIDATKAVTNTAVLGGGTVSGNGNGVNLQIGANQSQSMTLNFADMRANALGLTGTGSHFTSTAGVSDGTSNTSTEKGLDVSTAANASYAITAIDTAINGVSTERAKMGAYENRLSYTNDNLTASSQNISDAQSRIANVDMASEMMNQSQSSVLAQAAQAMLAQANQQPQQVLQLLR